MNIGATFILKIFQPLILFSIKLDEISDKIYNFLLKCGRKLARSHMIWLIGKSKCISEGHGGAGLACGPASAHCIHRKS